MSTIKEQAAEFEATLPTPATPQESGTRVRCYLAGAKAACELGSLTLAEASQYTMALAVLRETTEEEDAKFKLTADTLLEASKTIAELLTEPTET